MMEADNPFEYALYCSSTNMIKFLDNKISKILNIYNEYR
jgi:hypothetical protein